MEVTGAAIGQEERALAIVIPSVRIRLSVCHTDLPSKSLCISNFSLFFG